MKHVFVATLTCLLLASCSKGKSPVTPETHPLVGTWDAIGELTPKTKAKHNHRTFREQPRVFLIHTPTDTTLKGVRLQLQIHGWEETKSQTIIKKTIII